MAIDSQIIFKGTCRKPKPYHFINTRTKTRALTWHHHKIKSIQTSPSLTRWLHNLVAQGRWRPWTHQDWGRCGNHCRGAVITLRVSPSSGGGEVLHQSRSSHHVGQANVEHYIKKPGGEAKGGQAQLPSVLVPKGTSSTAEDNHLILTNLELNKNITIFHMRRSW